MNNSIYIAQNNKDTYDFNIPAFDTGAISTAINTPVSNEVATTENVQNNSIFFLSFLFIVFIVLVILAFCFRKKPKEEEKTYHHSTQQRVRRVEETEPSIEYVVDEKREKNTLYRYTSNKKTSLSTPTSINKCIRAFLENTKEN